MRIEINLKEDVVEVIQSRADAMNQSRKAYNENH